MRIHRYTHAEITGLLITTLLVATGCPQEDIPAPEDQDMAGSMEDMSSMPDTSQGADDGRPDQGETMDLVIESLSPTTGDVSGGTSVLIDGRGFAPGAIVRFGGVDATGVEVRSPTQLIATTPAYDVVTTVDVEVINPDGKSVTKSGAFEYTTGGIVSTPLFCQLQAQSPVTVMVGDTDAAALYTVIFADGITQGAGQGLGVTAELGVGVGDDYTNFTFQEMTYNVDKDGLMPGDLSNDEYVATPPVDMAGSFRYVARIRTDGEYVYCDLDGSENGVAVEQLGQLEVQEEPPAPGISYCQLVSPDPVDALSGQQSPLLLARVFNMGITQGAGQGDMIEGELGYGDLIDPIDTWTYTSLDYQGDADGLTPGDLANDEYGASLIIPAAGSYRYVARFRRQGDADWFYCDLDGHDDNDPFEAEQAGLINVTEPAVPSIGFCQTETLSVSVRPNMATSPITGTVYMQGVTEGAGQGAGIQAELVWGPAGSDPSTWTDSQAASYSEDVDGLNPGDLANDRFTTTLTPSVEGDYEFAYRFSSNGGVDWIWCDTDGSSSDPSSFETDKLGVLDVATINLPDTCRIQFPVIVHDAEVNTGVTIYGRVTELGVTDVVDDAPEISAQLLVGPPDADPITESALFDVVQMSYTLATPASATEDEYVATWTPQLEGLYKFLVRVSVDSGANFALCDLDGGTYEPLKAGAIAVHASTPDPIDYCHVFQGQVSQSLADPTFPIFTAEVYEGGLTDGNGGANSAQLEAEVGYGAVATNPALSGAYSWQPAPFTQVNPGNTNNYEYQGSPYGPATVPAANMTYDVVIRVREAGRTNLDWTYCDNLSSSSDFLISNVSKLDVLP